MGAEPALLDKGRDGASPIGICWDEMGMGTQW